MDLYVNQIERVETSRVDAERENGWIVHLVASLDVESDIVLWGDLETDNAEVASQFALGQRWTFTPH